MTLDSYVTLGNSGLRVSPFTLGTMTFGEDNGWGTSEKESTEILSRYLELGGNSVDTANIYTNGHSEKIIGDWIAGHRAERDRLVLGSKFFANLHVGDPNGGGAGRKAIVQQLEASLRRLQTDYLDVYWLHNWDRGTPVEETLRTLDTLVAAGKIRYVGISDLPAWKAAEFQVTARFRGWTPAVAMQIEYNLIERTGEGELLPMAAEHQLAVLPWSPLRRGMLSGKYIRGGTARLSTGSRGPDEREFRIIDVLTDVAAQAGTTPAAAALAWVHSRPGVTSTILGARDLAQFEANIAAFDVTLGEEQIAALDEVSAPALNFPAANNRDLAPILQFAGATVDGRPHTAYPPLVGSTVRY